MRTIAIAALLCGVLGMEGCAIGNEADAWPDKVVSSTQLRNSPTKATLA